MDQEPKTGNGRLKRRYQNLTPIKPQQGLSKSISKPIKALRPSAYQKRLWYIDRFLIRFDGIWYNVSNVSNTIKLIRFDTMYQTSIKTRILLYQMCIKNARALQTRAYHYLLAYSHPLAYAHPLAYPIHSHIPIYSNMSRGELKNNQCYSLASFHPLASVHRLAHPHLLIPSTKNPIKLLMRFLIQIPSPYQNHSLILFWYWFAASSCFFLKRH